MGRVRVIHYINQFFAGIGGEECADVGPSMREGVLGPGRVLQQVIEDRGEVVATIFCGDNYAAEHPDRVVERVMEYIRRCSPDVVVAGPAFAAGRYGFACGRICSEIQERLDVPTVTGMHPENPAVELYRSKLYIVPTGATAAGMTEALRRIAPLAVKLGRGEPIGPPADEGYLPRGLRFCEIAPQPAAVRAVDMLVARLRGEAFQTEWPLPQYDRVPPPPPVRDLREATIALVTSGGIVPKNNPDRIESTFATKWLRYNIAGVSDLTAEEWQSVHGGYDTTNANQDPNRVLPVDALRELEAAGVFRRLHNYVYVTVGSGASIASAKKFGREIAGELASAQVDGVIFVAT